MSWFSKLRRGMFGGPSPTYDGIGGGRRAIAWQVGNPGAVAALAFTQGGKQLSADGVADRNAPELPVFYATNRQIMLEMPPPVYTIRTTHCGKPFTPSGGTGAAMPMQPA